MDQTSNSGAESYNNRTTPQPGNGPAGTQPPSTIPVIEEQVQLGTKTVEEGGIRITKVVHEQQVPVSVPLTQEEHEIERVPINEYVDTPPPPIRYEGSTMIIPIVQEVMVVEKRLLVVEELHITKHQVQTQDTQQVNLRKEEIRIERVPPDPATGGAHHPQ